MHHEDSFQSFRASGQKGTFNCYSLVNFCVPLKVHFREVRVIAKLHRWVCHEWICSMNAMGFFETHGIHWGQKSCVALYCDDIILPFTFSVYFFVYFSYIFFFVNFFLFTFFPYFFVYFCLVYFFRSIFFCSIFSSLNFFKTKYNIWPFSMNLLKLKGRFIEHISSVYKQHDYFSG